MFERHLSSMQTLAPGCGGGVQSGARTVRVMVGQPVGARGHLVSGMTDHVVPAQPPGHLDSAQGQSRTEVGTCLGQPQGLTMVDMAMHMGATHVGQALLVVMVGQGVMAAASPWARTETARLERTVGQ